MQKILLSTMVIITSCGAGYAAQKCILLDTSGITPCQNPSSSNNTTEWSVTCPYNGINIEVQGMGICAGTSGSLGSVADTLTISDQDSDNTHCWCRMIVPAPSKWAHLASSAITDCTKTCAQDCANYMTGTGSSTPVRIAMFKNLL